MSDLWEELRKVGCGRRPERFRGKSSPVFRIIAVIA